MCWYSNCVFSIMSCLSSFMGYIFGWEDPLMAATYCLEVAFTFLKEQTNIAILCHCLRHMCQNRSLHQLRMCVVWYCTVY